MILSFALDFALGCFVLAWLMNLWLLMRGPGIVDRVLAVDTMVVNSIALIILYGIRSGSALNFEAVILFSLTGFVGTVAYAKYLTRGNVIE
jgi:multicomponent K+:H+ antiporter subunit F